MQLATCPALNNNMPLTCKHQISAVANMLTYPDTCSR
jgi:hypothetical protein